MFRSSACSWLESVLKLQSTVFTHIHDVLGTILFSLVGRGPHGLILDDIGSWNGFLPLRFPRTCKKTNILDARKGPRRLPELTLHLTMPSRAIAPSARLVTADLANWEFRFCLGIWTCGQPQFCLTQSVHRADVCWLRQAVLVAFQCLHSFLCAFMHTEGCRGTQPLDAPWRTHASTYLPACMTTLPNISKTL